MSIKKTSYYKAKEASTEIEPVDPNDPMMVEEEADCCICDNPANTQCSAEATFGMVYTTAGAQFIAFWGMK